MKHNNVVFVFDGKYIGQFKVTCYSLLYNNSHTSFNIHILYSGLTDDEILDITDFITKYGSVPFFYKTDISMFAGLPKMPNDDSYSTYKKLLIPELLKISDKVLYLDCDIIVNGEISELFNNESPTFLSAAKDIRINLKRKEHVKEITGNKNNVYFNAGVMLFDLAKSNGKVSKDKACTYMVENAQKLRFHDQDMFNHFYSDNYTMLDGKYNYMTTFSSVKDIFCSRNKKNAVILHYANWKPWNENYIGKFYGVYKKYYKMCSKEKNVNFMKKRKFSAQLKLIFSYLRRR